MGSNISVTRPLPVLVQGDRVSGNAQHVSLNAARSAGSASQTVSLTPSRTVL